MRGRNSAFMATIALLVVAVLAVPASSSSRVAPGEPALAKVCGILPGEGAYSYVKTWNISCKRARKVAKRAYEKFCAPPMDCEIPGPDAGYITGKTSFNGWHCKLSLGYEFANIRCKRGNKRLVQESAA